MSAPDRLARRVAHAHARAGHLADRSRRPARRGRLHAPGSGRRVRRVLRARRRRRLLSRPARDEPIRLEFIGDTIESIRTYDPATQRSTASLDQAAIVPLQELLGETDDPDRSATVVRLPLGGRPPDRARVRARRGAGARSRSCTEQIAGELRRGAARRAARVAPPAELRASPGTTAAPWLEGATALETLGDRRRGTGRPRTSPVSRRSSSPAACRTGSPRSAAAASAATRSSSSRNSPGRAERTIELLADYDIFAVPIERAEDVARRGGARRRRPPLARLPAARRRAAALGRDRRLRGRAQGARAPRARRRGRSSPTSAI